MSEAWPVIVLGGSGYVAGELLRLTAGHPDMELAAAVSDSHAGTPLSASFGHLAPAYPDTRFTALGDLPALLDVLPRVAIFSAAPHGVSAALLDNVLAAAEHSGTDVHLVDASADFRFADAAAYEAVYGQPHGAPQRLAQFTCALPEHVSGTPTRHVGHPGCFATAMLLGAVPLVKLGLVEGDLFAAGITGSTGSGRKPIPTTHHPERHSNLYAYKPLDHRHAPEVVNLIEAATGARPALHFVPHSGPFARGIQVTLQARLRGDEDAATVTQALTTFYADAPFVQVSHAMPHLKHVAGSNHARLGVHVHGGSVVVCAVIDNLIKGAAGGAMQWMNRLLGLPETAGLNAPAPGWI